MPAEEMPAKERIVTAAMNQTAQKGWAGFALGDIRDDLKDIDIRHYIKNKNDILILMNNLIDDFVNDNLSESDSLSEKEIIFDFLMLRLEWLEKHKDGIIRLYDEAKRDPDLLLCCTLPIYRSMQHFSECSLKGTKKDNLKSLKYIGFCAIYIHTLRIWKDDQNSDYSKTLAHLDKILSRFSSYLSI